MRTTPRYLLRSYGQLNEVDFNLPSVANTVTGKAPTPSIKKVSTDLQKTKLTKGASLPRAKPKVQLMYDSYECSGDVDVYLNAKYMGVVSRRFTSLYKDGARIRRITLSLSGSLATSIVFSFIMGKVSHLSEEPREEVEAGVNEVMRELASL